MIGDRKTWLQVSRFIELGVLLPACTFVGWLVGAGLDRWLHTTWLYLLGLILGIAAGFVQLIRTVLAEEKKG
ncbi:MAG TPA: AtpZ/AtpI family protein [Terriglobales bacterium]|nr:AtpZ/AtpI family protein [Terriglobales bacterium]